MFMGLMFAIYEILIIYIFHCGRTGKWAQAHTHAFYKMISRNENSTLECKWRDVFVRQFLDEEPFYSAKYWLNRRQEARYSHIPIVDSAIGICFYDFPIPDEMATSYFVKCTVICEYHCAYFSRIVFIPFD